MTAQPTPFRHGHDESTVGEAPLSALIDQLRQNWDSGDNAANDDLVLRIRELIRRQRESVGPPAPEGATLDGTRSDETVPDGVGDEDQLGHR